MSLEITSPPIGEDTKNKTNITRFTHGLEITSPPIGEDTGVTTVDNQDFKSRNNLPTHR